MHEAGSESGEDDVVALSQTVLILPQCERDGGCTGVAEMLDVDHHLLQGKIQRRRIKGDGSPENVPMYPFEINSRLSELSLLDFSAQPVPGAVYADFDPLERERLRSIPLSLSRMGGGKIDDRYDPLL